jgi:hypothetical protein
MMNNQSLFFHSYSSTNVQKKTLYDKEISFQKLTLLILLMQMMYLINVLWAILNLRTNQKQIVKNVSVIFDGILIFFTIIIYLIWVMRHELFDTTEHVVVDQLTYRISWP